MNSDIYKYGVEKIQNRITLEQKKLEVLNSVQDIPNVRDAYLNFEYVDFGMPYNLVMLNETSTWLKELGWTEKDRMYLPSGTLVVIYRNPQAEIFLELNLRTVYPGSTCKLNKIGETVSPIYETVCMEA